MKLRLDLIRNYNPRKCEEEIIKINKYILSIFNNLQINS